MAPIRVYFLGSGQIAVPSLQELAVQEDIELVGIGTQPDRPAGRKRHLTPTPVGLWATAHGWEVDKPASVNSPDFLQRLNHAMVDVVVVIAFGQLLKAEILTLPAFGCLNAHASLLPRHRGASPIAAAILAGDEASGISFMRMDKGLDTGPVYCRVATPLGPAETTESLEDRLGQLAAASIAGVIREVCRKGMQPVPQAEEGATYAGKLRKRDGQIDWTEPAEVIGRKVRAFTPWPRASFQVPSGRGPKRIQLIEAQVCDLPEAFDGTPGQVVQADKRGFVVACGSEALRIEQLIPEGKAQMSFEAFLRGFPIEAGLCLGQDTPTGSVAPHFNEDSR